MVLGKIIRFGLPLSFLHCTIYQQNIWREGDERLAQEQKLSWRKFFGLIDLAISKTAQTVNLSAKDQQPVLGLVSKIDNLNLKSCWNTKIMTFFSGVDILVNKPSYAACLVYRKIKPYVESPHKSQQQQNS